MDTAPDSSFFRVTDRQLTMCDQLEMFYPNALKVFYFKFATKVQNYEIC